MRARIDLSPEYQRGKVWSKEKQQLLLDSIFRKMHVPQVYFRVLDNGYYECVDGQQRLTAIFDFFDNKVKLSKKFTPEYGGQSFEELPQDIKDVFEDHEVIIVELNKSSDEEIREMFDRLQRGMPLTAGERLNAKFGNMHDFISDISEHDFFKNANIRNYRGAFHQVCSQITALEMFGVGDVKFKNLEQMYDKYRNIDIESKELQQIKKVLNYLNRSFSEKTPELHSRAGIVSLYLLVSRLIKEYSVKDKEKVIHDFVVELERKLIEAEEKENNVELLKYLNAISHSSDSANSIKTRDEIITNYFFLITKEIEPLDVNRGFTEVQRIAIFRKDNETCQKCEKKIKWEDFHADHKTSHSRGGPTSVENGQVLCSECNLKKGSKI
jgi:hypothetical protein